MPRFAPPIHLESEPRFTPDEPTLEPWINGRIMGNGKFKIEPRSYPGFDAVPLATGVAPERE
jgi:hypothetical protein